MPYRIVIDLSTDLARQLYSEILHGALTNEEAAHIYFEFTETSQLSEPDKQHATIPQDDANVISLRTKVKELLAKDLGKALEYLEQQLARDSAAFDSLIASIARYNRVNMALQKGMIDFQSAELEFIKIDSAVIFLLNSLQKGNLL